jgi:hypothetical protein
VENEVLTKKKKLWTRSVVDSSSKGDDTTSSSQNLTDGGDKNVALKGVIFAIKI